MDIRNLLQGKELSVCLFKDSNLPPNDTTRWQQPSCYFIPFNVLSSTGARNRISALKGPRSNQLIYGAVEPAFKALAFLFVNLLYRFYSNNIKEVFSKFKNFLFFCNFLYKTKKANLHRFASGKLFSFL